MKPTDLHLVQIIAAAGRDPSDVTDTVWSAGYRKSDFTTEKIIEMAVSQTADTLLNGYPADTLPKTPEDLSRYHLNGVIEEAMWDGTPAGVAAVILMNGYKAGGNK